MSRSARSNIRIALALTLGAIAGAQSTQRVSLGALGNEAGYASELAAISGDGHSVAYVSWAQNIVPGVDNGKRQVYVIDRVTGAVVCASQSPSGQGGNGDSRFPVLSADGRWVAFVSEATDLTSGDTKGWRDVFAYDRQTGTLHLVSATPAGAPGDGDSIEPAISGNGRYVAFSSQAKDLVPPPSSVGNVYRRDLLTGQTVDVSKVASALLNSCRAPSISFDGHILTFWTWDDVLPGDHNQVADVLLVDLRTKSSELISVASDGTQADAPCFESSLSADGRYVAFDSYASTLVAGDTNGRVDVFVRDRALGTTERVSVSSTGGQAADGASYPSISDDGRWVAFTSTSNDLVPVDTTGADVFVHDRVEGDTSLVSIGNDGLQPQNGASSGLPTMSADGGQVAFDSWGLTPWVSHEGGIYVRDLTGCTATRASFCSPSATSIPGCVATLRSIGTPSISSPDDFVFGCDHVPGGEVAVAWFGPTGSQRVPFGTQGGIACIAPPFERTPAHAVAGSSGICNGQAWFSLADLLQASSRIEAGAVVHAALWIRDSNSVDGFALSDAIWFQVCP